MKQTFKSTTTCNTFHFPRLANYREFEYVSYADGLNDIKKLSCRFNDDRSKEANFNFFANSFNALVRKKLANKELQREIIEKFQDESLLVLFNFS